jgi:aminoglycoside adenylyltransferase-like protein
MQPLSKRIPRFLTRLGEVLAGVLGRDLVGLYTYGSLTYDAFEPRRSDIDCVAVVRRSLRPATVHRLRRAFARLGTQDRLLRRLQLTILVRGLLFRFNGPGWLFQFGRLTTSGSDGNPIIWVNILQCGQIIRGSAPHAFVPPISQARLRAALVRELRYLRDELVTTRSSHWRDRPFYRRYATLTLCRILYTFRTGQVVSKPVAAGWAITRGAPPHRTTVRRALRTSVGSVSLRALRDLLVFTEATVTAGRLARA